MKSFIPRDSRHGSLVRVRGIPEHVDGLGLWRLAVGGVVGGLEVVLVDVDGVVLSDAGFHGLQEVAGKVTVYIIMLLILRIV